MASKRILAIVSALVVLVCAPVFAQQVSIVGVVTDETKAFCRA